MERLTAKKAADYLGLKQGTLAAWRWRGVGPEYIKIGSRVRYELSALERFVQAGKISPVQVDDKASPEGVGNVD